MAADILVCWPARIWLGDRSSVMKMIIERFYGCAHLLNYAGQYYKGRVGEGGPVLDTGFGRRGERLHQLEQHIHDLGPAVRRADAQGAGWIPARGNQRWVWDAGCRSDFENPEYRCAVP
jgi:hypothetical protein